MTTIYPRARRRQNRETNVLAFEILGLPKMTNTLRVHWRVKNDEAKLWKRLVANAVLLERDRPTTPFTNAKLTLTRHSAREPDYDGLVSSFKHVIDGLKEAQVIVDDKASVIGRSEYLWILAKPRAGKISVRVEGKYI